MFVIIILNIFAVLCSYLAKYKKYSYFLKIGFVVLTVVFGLRYGYGNDYFNYYESYVESITYHYSNLNIEIGWYYLCRLFKPLGYFGLVFFLTAFINYLVYRFIKHNVDPKWYWLATFIFLFQPNYMLLGTSMLRQMLVSAIFLNCLKLISERRILLSLGIILLCTTIHEISMIFIPFIFMDYIKGCFKKKWFYIIFVGGLYVVWISREMFAERLLMSLLESENDFANYFNYGDEGVIGTKEIILMLLFAFYMMRNNSKLSAEDKISCILVLASVFIMPFVTVVVMLRRIMYMFGLFQLSSFPAVIANERNIILRHFFVMCILLFTLIDFFRFFHGETYGPYFIKFNTIFQSPTWL